MRSFVPFLVLSAALTWNGAAAQDMPTVLPYNYDLMDILNRQRVEAAIGAPPAKAVPGARPSAAPTTSYRPSPEVSARVRRDFIAQLAKSVGPQGAERFRIAMSRGDPVMSWASIVKSDGLAPGDVADAMAAYWVLNWVMANGADSTRAQAVAVRRQVRERLVATPSFRQLGEGQRQEMAESLMLNFLVQHAAYGDAMGRRDTPAMRKLGEAAVTRFRTETGMDLKQLKLTDQGLAAG